MRIEVTQADIDKALEELAAGTTARAYCCPVAQALKRQTGKEYGVATESILTPKNKTNALPEAARDWIKRFDSGEPVGPVALNIPVS